MSPQHLISPLSCHHLGAPAPAVSPLLIFPRVALPLAGHLHFLPQDHRDCLAPRLLGEVPTLRYLPEPNMPTKTDRLGILCMVLPPNLHLFLVCSLDLAGHLSCKIWCQESDVLCLCTFYWLSARATWNICNTCVPFRPPCFHPPPPGLTVVQVQVHVRPRPKYLPPPLLLLPRRSRNC